MNRAHTNDFIRVPIVLFLELVYSLFATIEKKKNFTEKIEAAC
jgi:hypothetical protein